MRLWQLDHRYAEGDGSCTKRPQQTEQGWDAVALAIQRCRDMKNTSREAIKKELNKDYAALCNSTTMEPSSEVLFGGLSKLTKDITDAKRLTKKVPGHLSPQQSKQPF